jgi:pimeloyl-ACP methyl ester carboxylesterase
MLRRMFCIGLMVLLRLFASAGRLSARAPGDDAPDPVPMPTLGGKQFWADELFFHQWRIQRNVISGDCRLLDENDWRHSTGTYEHCLAVLERIKRERKLPPMKGKAVVVLHGLVRSRASMDPLCKLLREKGGYRVFNVEYPSTKYEMARHARCLRNIVNNLDGVEEINFVGHSMGNIVIRHYLGDLARAERGEHGDVPPLTPADRRAKERFGRFVMLAPPNQGALLAKVFADNLLFQEIAGEAGQELGRQWPKLEKRLATPPMPFGIIAGGKDDGRGFNPLLPGDNDGIVGVDAAKLAGAADFTVLPVLHSWIVYSEPAQQCMLRFLQHGYFHTPQKRNPLKERP